VGTGIRLHRYTFRDYLAVVASLSGTIGYDLGETFEHDRQIRAMRAVIDVWQDRRQIELRDRAADGNWRVQRFGPGQTVSIDGLARHIRRRRALRGRRRPVMAWTSDRMSTP
jgi:hypothetical protein